MERLFAVVAGITEVLVFAIVAAVMIAVVYAAI